MTKTEAGRARQRERLQRDLADGRKREAKIATAVRTDKERTQYNLERTAGQMLLDLSAGFGSWQPTVKEAQDFIGCWMGWLDRAADDPVERELAFLRGRCLQTHPLAKSF